MNKPVLRAIFFVYLLMLAAGFMSDTFLPAFGREENVYTFHGSYTIGFTLANMALFLAAALLLIILVSINRMQTGSLSIEIIIRRILVAVILVLLLGGSLAGSIYILSKKILVSSEKITYYSLIETNEVHWSDIEKIEGNFVAGSRLGLGERGDYAWVDFTTRKGEIIHFSLRFIQGVSQLETVIHQLSRM